MKLGAKLRELSTLRLGVALSLVLGLVVAVFSVYQVRLLPPGLHSRNLEIGVASTEVLVDAPRSSTVSLGATKVDIQSLTTHADLLGNVMTSAPVVAYIARVAHIAPTRIDVSAPMSADVPRVLIEPGSGQGATAILASADRYKLQIQADPAVPILHIYAQAPSKSASIQLANAAVQGLRNYLAGLSTAQGVPASQQLRVEQMGVPQGGVINHGVAIEIALLAFTVTFGLSCCAVPFAARVRRGWNMARLAEQLEP